jgi:magnesium-transporting ATPase (P-type)
MDKQPHKLKKQKSEFLAKVSKKELILGSVIATFIAITPYLITLWEGVPSDTKSWDTFLFSYTTTYYVDIQSLVWTLLSSLIPLSLLLIWIFTCKHWWYHVIIVPIVMYIYQIITILNDDLEFSETNLILWLLPVMAIVIPSIYLLRARMADKIDEATKTMEELEEDLMAKPKGFWDRITQYF